MIIESMSELDCKVIEIMAVTHLIRCAFSDFTIATNETGNSLEKLKKEFKE